MTKHRVYIAGPLFSRHERLFLESMVDQMASDCALDPIEDFFLPHRDVGDVGISIDRPNAFEYDLKALDSAQVVVALLDGQDVDSGTAVEIGYALAKGKTILGLLTDQRAWIDVGILRINNMIWGACGKGRLIFNDSKALSNVLKSELKLA
jgi:nucleoside 2-deoxyribosyltransferase